jgi:hypothetical protein
MILRVRGFLGHFDRGHFVMPEDARDMLVHAPYTYVNTAVLDDSAVVTEAYDAVELATQTATTTCDEARADDEAQCEVDEKENERKENERERDAGVCSVGASEPLAVLDPSLACDGTAAVDTDSLCDVACRGSAAPAPITA